MAVRWRTKREIFCGPRSASSPRRRVIWLPPFALASRRSAGWNCLGFVVSQCARHRPSKNDPSRHEYIVRTDAPSSRGGSRALAYRTTDCERIHLRHNRGRATLWTCAHAEQQAAFQVCHRDRGDAGSRPSRIASCPLIAPPRSLLPRSRARAERPSPHATQRISRNAGSR
jgi:hypothetical protein